MKKPLFSYLVLLLAFVLACDSNHSSEAVFGSQNSTVYEKKATFKEADVRKFPLDAKSKFFSYSTRIDQHGSEEWFSFINRMTNALYVYDNKTNELLNVIEMEKEGPDGVGELTIASHVMLANGGALVFNIWLGTLFDVSPEGKVRKKYPIRNYKMESAMSNPEPSQRAPLQLVGDDLYIVCSIDSYQTDYSDIYTMMVYNLSDEEFRSVYTLPDDYNSGYWGAVFKYMPSFDYNEKTGNMVMSYPIDPNIYEMGLSGEEVSRHYESSSEIAEMPPLRADINYGKQKDHGVADPEQREYSFTTSDFAKIMYDKYRNVYYRIAYIRPSVERYRGGDKVIDFSVSILDENFVKIGERKFSGETYSLTLVLVGEEGLFIGRDDIYAQDEDYLPVSVFTMVSQ